MTLPIDRFPPTRIAARRLAQASLAAVTLLLSAGCSLFPSTHTRLYEGPDAQILLEEVVQRGSTSAFRSSQGLGASHPIAFDATIIEGVLRGFVVSDGTQTGQSAPPPSDLPSRTQPLLADHEITRLTPLLLEAFSRATPSQFVVFRLPRTAPPSESPSATALTDLPNGPVAGALYVYGRSIHATLTEFPQKAAQAGSAQSRPSFAPSSALRPESYRRTVLPYADTLPAFVIDYQALPRQTKPTLAATAAEPAAPSPAGPNPSPMSGVAPAPAASTPSAAQLQQEIQILKELVIKKDLELERMRQELQQATQGSSTPTTPQAPPAAKKPSAGKALPPRP